MRILLLSLIFLGAAAAADESRAPLERDSSQLRVPMSELEPMAVKISAALAEAAKGN